MQIPITRTLEFLSNIKQVRCIHINKPVVVWPIATSRITRLAREMLISELYDFTIVLFPQVHQMRTWLLTTNHRNMSIPRWLAQPLDVVLSFNPPPIISCDLFVYLNNTPPMWFLLEASSIRIVHDLARTCVPHGKSPIGDGCGI